MQCTMLDCLRLKLYFNFKVLGSAAIQHSALHLLIILTMFTYICILLEVEQITAAEITGVKIGHGNADAARLYVEYNGVWSTVCRVDFDNEDAAVFCRMLGYKT